MVLQEDIDVMNDVGRCIMLKVYGWMEVCTSAVFRRRELQNAKDTQLDRIMYICSLHLRCAFAVYICSVHLRCTFAVYNIAVYICVVHLQCTFAVYICSIFLQCPFAVPICSVHLHCTFAVYICGVQLQCTFAVYICSVHLQCTILQCTILQYTFAVYICSVHTILFGGVGLAYSSVQMHSLANWHMWRFANPKVR